MTVASEILEFVPENFEDGLAVIESTLRNGIQNSNCIEDTLKWMNFADTMEQHLADGCPQTALAHKYMHALDRAMAEGDKEVAIKFIDPLKNLLPWLNDDEKSRFYDHLKPLTTPPPPSPLKEKENNEDLRKLEICIESGRFKEAMELEKKLTGNIREMTEEEFHRFKQISAILAQYRQSRHESDEIEKWKQQCDKQAAELKVMQNSKEQQEKLRRSLAMVVAHEYINNGVLCPIIDTLVKQEQQSNPLFNELEPDNIIAIVMYNFEMIVPGHLKNISEKLYK